MKKKTIYISLLILLIALAVLLTASLSINYFVKHNGEKFIISQDEAIKLTDVDCILVLGCGVREDGSPSNMLEDRLTRGISLYNSGVSEKLLMSGDHGQKEYNEVGTMKQYAIDAGIESSDIFMDHAGFSTYESIYRAKEIFGANKIVIVTQEYHLPRALYIAKELGIEAYGVSSDYNAYAGQTYRDFREVFARCKDFFTAAFKPKPTFLGEAIPVSGNGDYTNDELTVFENSI